MSEPTADDDALGPEAMKDMNAIAHAPLPPGIAIGAVALNFALKYHGINIVSDGVLYQQYKLEGRNLQPLHLDDVFETAIKMEQHLLATSDRIAKIVIDAIQVTVDEDEPEPQDNDPST